MMEINWQLGPAIGKLGTVAEIQIPEGAAFAASEGAQKFLELSENPPSGNEFGVLLNSSENGDWFAIFSYDAVGYVKDDEKDSLDADAILESIRNGTEEANKIRRERGWSTLDIVGWEQEPFYDSSTHNLTWAIRGRSTEGDDVNYNTRMLGRGGVMSATLVTAPEQLAAQQPEFAAALSSFAFTSSNRYAEFREGDKVAAYGLTALVVGGAAAVAAKSGLLAKFWKLIVAAVAAAGVALKKLFGAHRRDTGPITRFPEQGS